MQHFFEKIYDFFEFFQYAAEVLKKYTEKRKLLPLSEKSYILFSA